MEVGGMARIGLDTGIEEGRPAKQDLRRGADRPDRVGVTVESNAS